MELILVSYDGFFKNEPAMVNSLLEEFDFTFHLRKPRADTKAYEAFINEIKEQNHDKIMVSNTELHKKYNVKGVHIPSRYRRMTDKYHLNYSSTSCHSILEVKALEGVYNCIYISPVFPSISKKGYKGNLDMAAIKDYLAQPRESKVYALGGITNEKISEVKELGFEGAAVLGAVWGDDPDNNSKIEENFEKIYRCTV